ncbi:TPA: 4Fe-4S ferredoxin [Candidatus Poribacteria bacterium]|nr:4Fe-4S ferredoxin [Candidatus Poribacteria bacterium]
MRRKIVSIDEEKCNGCGQCVIACAEGAIEIIDGKAKLVSDIYCDGLGACLGECPVGAITIIEREAQEFDEKATEEHLKKIKGQKQPQQQTQKHSEHQGHSCPGSLMRELRRSESSKEVPVEATPSELLNWPVQLKLVSPHAPYFKGADLLLVADCVPFALADFHSRFLRGKPVIIGCPKLDDADFYINKLAQIIKNSSLNSLTVVHMEVPCCSGLTYIANEAIDASGADIQVDDVTISISGEVLEDSRVTV